ncbi:hypothetical protein Syun_010451 [Stephania yunnanensis]|uniref:Uncharacterized protein n=1 Tax=Stephania yunnanensis TaxID=152371 RepID=A0AAP0KGI9_9MAGN
MEQAFPFKRIWDGKMSEDPCMDSSKKIRFDYEMNDLNELNTEAGEHSLIR